MPAVFYPLCRWQCLDPFQAVQYALLQQYSHPRTFLRARIQIHREKDLLLESLGWSINHPYIQPLIMSNPTLSCTYPIAVPSQERRRIVQVGKETLQGSVSTAAE